MPPIAEPISDLDADLPRLTQERSEALASISDHERSIAKLLARIEVLDEAIARLSSGAEPSNARLQEFAHNSTSDR